jgi:hypothetical protein
MVKTNIQTFSGEVEILSNLHVGNYLTANGTASNVLDITGNVGATFFVGDGGFLSNIATTLNDIVANPGGNTVSNTLVFESGADVTSNTAIVTYANVGISISNTEPTGEFQLSIGSNIFVNTHAANVLTIIGSVGANTFIGDGGFLSNIATTLDDIISNPNGNSVSNTVVFISGQDPIANTAIVTHKDVGISVSNVNPTGEFQFGVGSNLFVNTYSSNVLSIEGNVNAQKMTLGTISVTSAYGLNHVTAQGSATGDTISLSNVTTGLEVTSNITAGGNVTAETVITSANVEVGNRLKFASNVFVDDLRIADLAANLVTYDKTTGELMDSGGLFSNKLAVVSVQPPSALTANATTIAKHGTYTVTTSSLAENSNAWNAFDGDSAVEWTSSPTVGHLYSAGESTYAGTSNLFTGNYIQPGVSSAGEWLAIEFPYKTTLRHMKLTPPATLQRYPASANVYATNDSLTWTEVAQWGDVDPVTSSNVQTVVVNATESFKKYAIVVTKANGGADNVALAKWDLFAESFSIDGGQISMAQQPTTGGETMMEQSGPHGRGVVPLKKYPEIIFEDGKFDYNHSTNTYVQAGYTVSASSQDNSGSRRVSSAFNGIFEDSFVSGWQSLTRYSTSTGLPTNDPDNATFSVSGVNYKGQWVKLELPKKIRIESIVISSCYDTNSTDDRRPENGAFLGSNDNLNWELIKSFSGDLDYKDSQFDQDSVATRANSQAIINGITNTSYYKYLMIVVTKIATTNQYGPVQMNEIEYYGYEEDIPLGDTSVDTTFTSIMNTPQTTGANVYVDGNLGETFTNRVVGPTVSNTHTTYVSTEKYWELSGNVESNVTLEANTFLSGDAPHSISMWFNSSNLVSNASNSCIFSLATEEKLDSVNLDLQSNTWHNLTYAYQGEGGSRVTYLDGRKVAEDQAEDTFGDYPPFAMTGYSQGGYVASASGVGIAGYAPYAAFRPDTGGYAEHWVSGKTYATSDPRESTNSTLSTWIGGGGGHNGEWVKIQMPHKIVLEYVDIVPRVSSSGREPRLFSIVGSNDDINWYLVHEETTRTFTSSTGAPSPDIHVMTGPYATTYWKYFAVVIRTGATDNTYDYVAIGELKLYGHRENDLVRLPDPTNVLKYPHIAMTGPAQRGYVASESSHYALLQQYAGWKAFDAITDDPDGWVSANASYQSSGTTRLPISHSTGSGGIDNLSGIDATSSGGDTSRNGSWLKIELPHKLKLSQMKLFRRQAVQRIVQGFVYGSNDNITFYQISNNLSGISNIGTYSNTDPLIIIPTDTTTAYKYFVVQVTASSTNHANIGNLEFYGTQEGSVPIQIGGGNIDKVANFRVYDKFVGEDQALEIWDAQKDEFGRAKSSMTLHKGRIGIGTTEPEGRLAVLDEPHNLEEFPPRAMTGYKNYFEGHGEFCASVSEEYGSADKAWNNFDKGSTNWTGGTSYTGTNNTYEGTHTTGGYGGDYIELKLPYKIKLQEFIIQPSPTLLDRWSKSGVIMAKNTNNDTWTNIFSWSGSSVASVDAYNPVYFKGVDTSNAFDTFRLVITSVYSQPYVTLFQWKLFGTREQGQSVLHDGQLTLTKNLNVPRIGPALDADDTPRRDRLVVEYNTSTNPTFEGAVRDTSGRGLDGAMKGLAIYDATKKALVFDGATGATSSVIEVGEITNYNTNWVHSVSVWLNMHSPANYETVYSFGDPAAAARNNIAIHIANTQFLAESTGGSSTKYWNITGGAWKVGIWEHFVFVRDESLAGVEGFKIYQNGEELASTGGTNASTAIIIPRTSTFRIGQRITSANDQPYDGDLSQFKLYDCALTASEVKTLYDMGRCDEGHHMVNFSKTRVGIGLGDGEAPRGALDVRGNVGIGGQPTHAADGNAYPDEFPACPLHIHQASHPGIVESEGIRFSNPANIGRWNLFVSSTNQFRFVYNGAPIGYVDQNDANAQMNFTGQHRTFIKDVPFSQVGELEGLIVSSDQNKYIKMSGGIEAGSNAITMNESLPVVSLSATTNDKKCFGVISASEDPEERSDVYGAFGTNFEKEKGDTRVYINSVGEGAIWVSNIGGSLEAGDYITTSNVAGYGQKQESDSLKNYTVAKITMDCDFNPATQPIQQILRSNVIQTYYLGNVHKVKNVPHEFVTTTVGADDAWSNVSVSPSDTTYAEWSNLEANTQNTYTLTYTQTSNVVYDTKYTLTTTANVTESDPWDSVFVDPPSVTYAEYSNLEANTQSSYSLTFTKTTTDEKTPDEWSALESNTQSLYNMVYYQSVEEEVASDYPGATTHTRVTDVIENELDAHGQIQWEDHATETEKAYKIRYLDVSGAQTDSANAVHIAAFVGCTYHCG